MFACMQVIKFMFTYDGKGTVLVAGCVQVTDIKQQIFINVTKGRTRLLGGGITGVTQFKLGGRESSFGEVTCKIETWGWQDGSANEGPAAKPDFQSSVPGALGRRREPVPASCPLTST